MSRLTVFFLALSSSLVLAVVSFAQTLEGRPPQPATSPMSPRALANNEPNYLKLRNIKLGTETIHVKDFTLKREAGHLYVQERSFSIRGAGKRKDHRRSFVGDGSFVLTPPIELERRNLAILTKGQPFEEQFSTLVLRFTDGRRRGNP